MEKGLDACSMPDQSDGFCTFQRCASVSPMPQWLISSLLHKGSLVRQEVWGSAIPALVQP
jgi:hypothetical protein